MKWQLFPIFIGNCQVNSKIATIKMGIVLTLLLHEVTRKRSRPSLISFIEMKTFLSNIFQEPPQHLDKSDSSRSN